MIEWGDYWFTTAAGIGDTFAIVTFKKNDISKPIGILTLHNTNRYIYLLSILFYSPTLSSVLLFRNIYKIEINYSERKFYFHGEIEVTSLRWSQVFNIVRNDTPSEVHSLFSFLSLLTFLIY